MPSHGLSSGLDTSPLLEGAPYTLRYAITPYGPREDSFKERNITPWTCAVITKVQPGYSDQSRKNRTL